jgi:hypothetical protein
VGGDAISSTPSSQDRGAYVWCAVGANAAHKGISTLVSQLSSTLLLFIDMVVRQYRELYTTRRYHIDDMYTTGMD